MVAERIEARTPGAVKKARQALSSGGEAVLQFADLPYPRELLDSINGLCAEFGERLKVRFYGHYGSQFDFGILEAIPDVANLATDCLQRATNVETLKSLTQLRRLSFGVYHYDSASLLDLLNPIRVLELSLGENAERNFDLGGLAEFEGLETLFVEGHTKGIESLGELPSLTQLRLRCTPRKQRLDFVSTIPRLRFLQIVLGGREEISEIVSPSLEELEILRVRGFAHFPNLANVPALRSLQIEDQLRLTQLTIPGESTSRLAKLVINNCKKLSQVKGLAHLRSLEHLRFCVTALDLESLIESGLPESLRVFAFYTGKDRENARARELLDSLGYADALQRA